MSTSSSEGRGGRGGKSGGRSGRGLPGRGAAGGRGGRGLPGRGAAGAAFQAKEKRRRCGGDAEEKRHQRGINAGGGEPADGGGAPETLAFLVLVSRAQAAGAMREDNDSVFYFSFPVLLVAFFCNL
jgi:hypothetical protein